MLTNKYKQAKTKHELKKLICISMYYTLNIWIYLE